MGFRKFNLMNPPPVPAGSRLTPITTTHGPDGSYAWECRCECGGTVLVGTNALTQGRVTQCSACAHQTRLSGLRQKTHGLSHIPEYRVWWAMRERCYYTAHVGYADYGGRGITVCDEWRESFEAFIRDMGRRPSDQHSIDRIDSDGPYTLSNCRWATKQVQSRNRRSAKMITHGGETLHVSQWSERTGISVLVLRDRLQRGWTAERALSHVPRSVRRSA